MRMPTLLSSSWIPLLLTPFIACDGDKKTADTTEPDTDTSDTGVEVEDTLPDTGVEVVEKPGLGIDYTSTAPGAKPRFDLVGNDWMSVGWPSNRFYTDGRVTLSNMPRGVAGLLDTYMDYGEEVLDGFGLNGAIYFELDQAIDTATLPVAADTMHEDSVIQLVNTTAGARLGERIPLVFRYYDGASRDPFFRPMTLAMRPVYGFVLQEGATYCALVTRAVKDAEGRYLQQADGFVEALETQAFLAPVATALDSSPLAEKDLATATCFTTQHATRELERVARYIDDQVPPELDLIYEPNVFGEFHGLYRAPNFQAGEKPYTSEDGDIRFEGDEPIPQAEEELRFLLLTPPDHPMPEGGWPVTLYAHGTGGDYESCRSDTRELVVDGVAVLCIDQPLHGPRGPGRELTENELVLFSFNFLNPGSGRSSFRQAAIDTLWLSRMVEAGRFDVPAVNTRARKEVQLDPERILFFGHSHGGLSGTLAIAVDSRIKAAVISGMSGVLIETILRRKDPGDLAALAATVLNIPVADLDTFHPALNLMQMLVDATDPISYTPLWLNPPANVPPKHVFVTEGTLDHASPSVGTDAAAAAGFIPQVRPLAKVSEPHSLRGMAVVDLPLRGNVDLGNGVTRTAAIRQWQGGSHFTAFTAADARAMWRRFLVSAGYEDVPELSTGEVALSRPAPTAVADTCAEATPIDTSGTFPLEVRGNTRIAGADFKVTCSGVTGEVGGVGRDVFYRFIAPRAGTYRFRIALPAPIDRDTPRFGPNVLAVMDTTCQSCLGARNAAGPSLDLELVAQQEIAIAIDGSGWLDAGPFTLVIEERCAVLECGERECGAWGCGTCGTCGSGEICDDGQCVPRQMGDTCVSPFEVTTLPFSWSGDTRAFAHDFAYSLTQCPDFPFGLGAASSDVVFRFDPPSSGRFLAKVDGDFDVNLWASESCESAATQCVGARRTGGRKVSLPLDATVGVPLYVIVDGASNTDNSAGHVTLDIDSCTPDCEGRTCGDDGCGGSCGGCEDGKSCVLSPGSCVIPYECPATTACVAIEGDLCESAFTIGALPYSDSRNTATFKNDYGYGGFYCPLQPDGSGSRDTRGFGAADVAYRFTAPRAGLYRFGLDTGPANAVFDAALYLAGDCSDIEATCLGADERDRNERVWANLAADQTVFAIVDGWTNFSNLTGNYKLEVRECVPSCANRTCGGDGCIGSCGTCEGGLTCQSGQCRAPVGVACDNPRGIGTLPWTETLDTSGYGADRDGCGGGSAASPDLTYRFEAPKAGTFRFTLSAEFAARLTIEDACANASCLGEIDGSGSFDLELVQGQVVFVTVDGVDSDINAVGGRFTLSVRESCTPQCEGKTCGPDGCGGTCGACALPADVCTAEQLCVDPLTLAGNTCESARVVGPLPFAGEGDSRGQTNDYLLDEGLCGGLTSKGVGSSDEVWRFTAPTTGRYLIELMPAGFDALLYVLDACEGPATTCVAADDGELSEHLTLDLSGGDSVFIVVDGEDNILDDAGAYSLRVRQAP